MYLNRLLLEKYLIECYVSDVIITCNNSWYFEFIHVVLQNTSLSLMLLVCMIQCYTCGFRDLWQGVYVWLSWRSSHRFDLPVPWLNNNIVMYEVLMVASMKIAVFWVVMPHSPVDVYHHFRGACCLHHHLLDGWGSKDLWNDSKLLPDYLVQQTRRQPSS
jgi:hypothetical protein